METIKNLKKIDKNDVLTAGGKGAFLGEIMKAGIPTPPGFVVLTSAYEKFMEENNLKIKIEAIMQKVNYKNIEAVERTSKKIRSLIHNAAFPKDIGNGILKEFKKLDAKYVAVRSSATAEDSLTASWAGELESYLNVTKSALLETVKKCWSSLFTPRAIFYRHEKNSRNQRTPVAAVIQKMVQSEISGLCFTVHPVTKNRSQMIIEAGYGLGKIIVGGKITPDTYLIRRQKNYFTISDKNISRQKIMETKSRQGTKETKVRRSKQKKQKLSDKRILKLAKICRNMEMHYGKPQDIEWAFEKNKLYILQSRPITAL